MFSTSAPDPQFVAFSETRQYTAGNAEIVGGTVALGHVPLALLCFLVEHAAKVGLPRMSSRVLEDTHAVTRSELEDALVRVHDVLCNSSGWDFGEALLD